MIYEYDKRLPLLAEDVLIAPGSHVIGDVEIGGGSSIWFNTVVRGDVNFIRIGHSTNIQDNSVVHVTNATHPTRIGNEVTAGHRVIIHGCTIEDRVLIGMGSIVMDGAVVGTEALIGAGSLVTPDSKIPPRVLAVGSPCKVVRDLRESELQFLQASALHYRELAKKYINNNKL